MYLASGVWYFLGLAVGSLAGKSRLFGRFPFYRWLFVVPLS